MKKKKKKRPFSCSFQIRPRPPLLALAPVKVTWKIVVPLQ